MPDLTDAARHFDKQMAETIVKRFLIYNQRRLERTQKALGERQRVFLEVLPLLYHVNHEKLPGFVSYECPCGMARYRPTKDTL